MEQAVHTPQPSIARPVICFALSAEFVEMTKHCRIPVAMFGNYLEFSQQRPESGCIVIGTHEVPKACKLLKNLRSDPAIALTPIYLLKDLGPEVAPLCDGVVDTIDEACDKAAPINKLLLDLEARQLADPGNAPQRLLGYLYSRPNSLLTPVGDWRNERFYSYPMMDAMIPPANGATVLQGLMERNLLAPAHLVDRLRHCPGCEGVHLNYIDTCPSCDSIEIEQRPFLHCFTCGHVGPDDQFIASMGLTCPKCAARLRHIGADYDRPLENFQCRACRHVFVDPKVTARCMHCDTANAPQDLLPRPLYALQLTEKGRISVRTGSVEEVCTLLDCLNNVDNSYFESIVDWLISLCRRYKEEQFSLLGIRIKNVVELTDRIGRLRVRELMDEFARRVRELIRSTDLTTRTNQYTLWLLLPKTDAKGCEIVRGRILALQADAGDGLELESVPFHAPSQLVTGEGAKLLMARMEGAIIE
ncbi:MAG: diguanylate cyclase [Desulfobacteraceae bacterium]|nr:diguanylate cyclase [Desulfobacteraceae bacterium]